MAAKRLLAAQLLLLCHQASTLSSHSPPDPLAYPKYAVSLSGWDHAINNRSATAILDSLQAEAHKDHAISLRDHTTSPQSDPAELRHTLMRSASGQAFLCALPPIPATAAAAARNTAQANPAGLPDLPGPETEDLERKTQREKIEQDGLQNGLKLLSSLKDRCIYTRLGWFTYSFCYGKGEIKQFHAIMLPGYNSPQEDPEQDVYVLGFHLDHPQNPHHQARAEGTLPAPSVSAGVGELTSLGRNRFASGGGSILGSISDVLRDEAVIKSSMELEEEEFEQKRYLVQRWDGGTTCDMTGKPRSVEVQFHCSTLGTDHIALLRETSICEYLLVIHTPRLCSEPLFLDGGARKGVGAGEAVANIGCRPVLTNEEIEQWAAREEARKSIKEEQDKQPQALDDTVEHKTAAEGTSPDDPRVPEGSAAKDQASGPSGDAPYDESAANDEPAPNSLPDQTVLGNPTGRPADQPDSEESSGSNKGSGSEKKDSKLEELDIDPITVYFDADTGKIYMDKAAADEARQGRPADGKSASAKTDSKADKRRTTPADQTLRGAGDELEKITNALHDSLGALLRDLRGDEADGRRAARARPKSLADLLASLGAKKKAAAADARERAADQPAPARLGKEQTSKLASESHAKLVEAYQLTFERPAQGPAAPGAAAPAADEKAAKDEQD